MINVKEMNEKKLSDKERIGKIIIYLRKQNKITQEQLAKDVGCDQSIISRIENGYEGVDRSIYNLALNVFSYHYDCHDQIIMDLEEMLERFVQAYILLDVDQVKSIIDEMEMKQDQNIYFEIHLRVIHYMYDYLIRKMNDCDEKLDHLYTIIDVLLPSYKVLFYFKKLNLALYESDFEKANEIIDYSNASFVIKNKDINQFLAYYMGWYHFKRNNRSKALKFLLDVRDYFVKTNNQIRKLRVDFIIATSLMREENYQLALRTLDKIAEDYQDILRNQDHFYILFSKGFIYYAQQKNDLAIATFRQALKIKDKIDKNYVYYYLLKLYSKEDDLFNYKKTLSKINYADTSYGSKMIDLFILYRLGKTENYYRYIEEEILPLLKMHYLYPEISHYLLELLDHYYKKGFYQRYHDLSIKIFEFFS